MRKKITSDFLLGFSQYYQKNRSLFYGKDNRVLKYSIVASITFILGLIIGVYLSPISSSFAGTNISVEQTSHTHADYSKKSLADKPTSTSSLSVARNNPTQNSKTSATENTSNYTVTISIPSIGLTTSLTPSTMTNRELSVPAYGVSYYKTLYMGHSTGVFKSLPAVKVGENIYVAGEKYTITSVNPNLPVASDRQSVGNYSMHVLTNLAPGDIVLMTCAGNYQPGFGWNARTLVFASKN